MELFLDSAQLEDIQNALDAGLIDGITTNPSLMKKAAEKHKGMPLDKYIDTILKKAGKRPVSLEVSCCSAYDMYAQAKHLWKRFKKKTNNVVIKIPINPVMDMDTTFEFDGLKTIRKLSKEGIPVNVTLVFTPEQALLAAKAGAAYVSPFLGRLDDKIREDNKIRFDKSAYFPAEGMLKRRKLLHDNGLVSGVDSVAQIRSIFDTHGLKTKIIAASMRNSRQVREAALAGAHIATVSYATMEEMVKHPKTQEGMQDFVKDMVKPYERILAGK